jgi:hypothetical protein
MRNPKATEAATFDWPAAAGPKWPAVAQQLDTAIVWVVAYAEGREPLRADMGAGPDGCCIFRTDVEDAKASLEEQRQQYPDIGELVLRPVPLGFAYKLSQEGKAIIVPAEADISDSGHSILDFKGQPIPLPLFACLEIGEEVNGKPVVPLFMARSDCAIAVVQAVTRERRLPPKIVSFALDSVVERLLKADSSGNGYSFVAKSSSVDYIQENLDALGMEALAPGKLGWKFKKE